MTCFLHVHSTVGMQAGIGSPFQLVPFQFLVLEAIERICNSNRGELFKTLSSASPTESSSRSSSLPSSMTLDGMRSIPFVSRIMALHGIASDGIGRLTSCIAKGAGRHSAGSLTRQFIRPPQHVHGLTGNRYKILRPLPSS